MLRVRSNQSVGPAACPLCREALGERAGAPYRCGGCQTDYHLDCAQELGGCSTLGCARRGKAPHRIAREGSAARSLIDWDEVESRSLDELRARTRPPAQSRVQVGSVLLTLASAAGVLVLPALGALGILEGGLVASLMIAAVLLLLAGTFVADHVATGEETAITRVALGASKWAATAGLALVCLGIAGVYFEPSKLGTFLACTGIGMGLLVIALCFYTASGGRHR